MDEVYKALLKQFGKKKAKAAELNWGAAKAGYEFALKTFTRGVPYRVERMNETAGKIIIDGNAACALGCMFAGVTVVTWYPITPSSSLDRKSTRLNSSHLGISYAVFCLKKNTKNTRLEYQLSHADNLQPTLPPGSAR